MASQRPASITVVAILNLVGGGLGLICCTGCGGFNLIANANVDLIAPAGAVRPASPFAFDKSTQLSLNIHRQVPAVVPGYKAFVYTNVLVSFVLDVLLIVSGIGLLMMTYWGRNMAISYAIISLVTKLMFAFYLLVFFAGPVLQIIDKEYAADPLAAAVTPPWVIKGTRLGTDFGWLLFGIYPIIVLILLLRPSIGQALARAHRDGRDPDEDDSPRRRSDFEDDDDRWRDRDDYRDRGDRYRDRDD